MRRIQFINLIKENLPSVCFLVKNKKSLMKNFTRLPNNHDRLMNKDGCN
jgi:hypothetical protein